MTLPMSSPRSVKLRLDRDRPESLVGVRVLEGPGFKPPGPSTGLCQLSGFLGDIEVLFCLQGQESGDGQEGGFERD